MGRKGDRASKEPLAVRLYAEGRTLAEIAEVLDVSTTSLSAWKAESRRPDQAADDWDRARAQRRGNIARLKELFERQVSYLEETPPDQVSAPMVDALSKLGALVEKWDKAETVVRKLGELEQAASRQGTVSAEELKRVMREVYGL